MAYSLFNKALVKASSCKRITKKEAFALAEHVTPDTLHDIGVAALENRRRRFGEKATYVFNIHINPTNICTMGCSFCSYAASYKQAHAYVLEEDEIFSKVKRLNPTEAHIVGGLNQIWPFERNVNLIRELRKRFPDLYIKAFTAVEIDYFAKMSKLSIKQVLKKFCDAGVDSLPGGGAEIFSDRLYKKHWKNKISPKEWINIHKLAHKMDIFTNATMLFGFGDTWQERVDHMLILREIQDETKGFVCFIPLAFQPGKGNFLKQGPTPLESLTVLALSRLIIDNISHLKSYWPMFGIETAGAGLSWGANDMDGTLTEEKIAHFAGSPTPLGMARDKMVDTILLAGFEPLERDGRFCHKKKDQP